jgi:hypothetical protein
MLSIGASHAPMRAGSGGGLLMAEVRYGRVTMEDGTALGGGSGMSRSSISSGSSGRSGSGSTMTLPVGTHTASSEFTVRIFPSVAFVIGPSGPDESDSNERQPLAEFTLKREKQFEVVPRDQEIVERVADPALEAAIRAAISIRTIAAWRLRRGTEVRCDVDIQDPPADVAFEVFVRAGEGEWSVGLLSARAGAMHERSHIGLRRAGGAAANRLMRDFPVDAKTVDVILRPSSEAAEDGGIYRIWDGEIIFRNIAIEEIVPNR